MVGRTCGGLLLPFSSCVGSVQPPPDSRPSPCLRILLKDARLWRGHTIDLTSARLNRVAHSGVRPSQCLAIGAPAQGGGVIGDKSRLIQRR